MTKENHEEVFKEHTKVNQSKRTKSKSNLIEAPIIVDIEDNNGQDNTIIVRIDKKLGPVESLRDTFKSGKSKSIKYRKEQLRNLLKFTEDCRPNIIDALYKDLRKHKQEVINTELDLIQNDLRLAIYELDNWCKPEKPSKSLANFLDDVFICSDPYGVVLIIGAWNYPILLTLGPMIGAIAAGNCVILKPSELSVATSELLSSCLPKYLDSDCYKIYLGGVEETTELLKKRFDYIFFTGSTNVGQIVHQAATKFLTPTTLELGGKSPVYLDNSTDFTYAVKRILWGKCLNSGQTCIAPDYLLCTKTIQSGFIREAREVLKQFYEKLEGEDDKNQISKYVYTDMSKIITERHFKRLVNFIEEGEIGLGGVSDPVQLTITPTILVNVKPDDPVMREEIFGPILPIVTIENADEAIEFINSREKPLALYVFSDDKKVQKKFLENTSSGGVSINDTIMHICVENLPFGGVGMSGMGAYHGKFGFDTFTHKKGVLVKNYDLLTETSLSARYPPYSDFNTNIISTVMRKRRSISMHFMVYLLVFLMGAAIMFVLQKFVLNF